MTFVPNRVYFDEAALEYSRGRKIMKRIKAEGVSDITRMSPKGRVTGIPGENPQQAYREGKKTLVVRIRKKLKFQTCRPSADYMLPLNSGCPGKCEYCYLATRFGPKPYITIYVNTEEILERAEDYIQDNTPEITSFEGAAASDPVPMERYSDVLADTIEYFAAHELGRFRFVTKFTEIDRLLDLEHNKKTEFRFSLNTDHVVHKFEHATPSVSERLNAAKKVKKAGYPLGFLIAPVLAVEDWKDTYSKLMKQISKTVGDGVAFEIITHRFTEAARRRILEVFEETALPMEEKDRKYRHGKFGYGKYVYPSEVFDEIEEFLNDAVEEFFDGATISYLV